jgi:hypothetical protein
MNSTSHTPFTRPGIAILGIAIASLAAPAVLAGSSPGKAATPGSASASASKKKDDGPQGFTASLVTAYTPCTKPNAVTRATAGVPLPTCMPVRPVDPQCVFGPGGRGRLSASAMENDVKIDIQVEGLTNCDGHELTFVVSSRSTVDFCPGGLCTTIEVKDFPVATCTVRKGGCAVNSTVNTYTKRAEGFKVFERGAASEITIIGCGAKREDIRLFECGLSVK